MTDKKRPDRRFDYPGWRHPGFCELKDSYLTLSRTYQDIFSSFVPSRDPSLFFLKNFLEALSPSNFAWTNPEVVQKTIETNGENLKKGWMNFQNDLLDSRTFGLPALTQFEHFQVGKNIACTPGHVVYENDICQLLYYTPQTDTVYAYPLLIVPPWINKFYIFDLSQHNSFVRWNLDQGRNVFLISWRNPDKTCSDFSFEDYIFRGIDTCVSFILNLTQSLFVNGVGLCLGGTALLTLMSYKKANAQRISSGTFLATPVDFSYLKAFSPFSSKDYLQFLKIATQETGLIPGSLMVYLFFFLRSNELVWPNYIKQYLMGENPPIIDFLYWNSDPMNIPASMHLDFLEQFFIENALFFDDLVIRGQPINLSHLSKPLFAVGTVNDHIAPWESVYALKQKCPHAKFVLGGSGHIAGIINPPSSHKYGYKTCEHYFSDSKDWLLHAQDHSGSWWSLWDEWIQKHSGEKIKSLREFPFIEPAPGRYVL